MGSPQQFSREQIARALSAPGERPFFLDCPYEQPAGILSSRIEGLQFKSIN